MLRKLFKSDKQKIITSFISILLFVYILLFEFVLPANRFLPKPTILFESVQSLFQDYSFISAFLFTFSAIYAVTIISFFLLKIGGSIGSKIILSFPGLNVLFDIGKYFIPLFIIFLFQLWFGNSVIGEYIFILIILMGSLKAKLFNSITTVEEEYILSARSLGVDDNKILSKVIWKSLQPKLYDVIISNHIKVWGIVLIYEFICKTDGIGYIFYRVLKYNDISVLIILFIFLIITFLVMEFVLSRIKKKYFFWE